MKDTQVNALLLLVVCGDVKSEMETFPCDGINMVNWKTLIHIQASLHPHTFSH